MQVAGWYSVARAADTRRIDSNFYAGPRDSQPLGRNGRHYRLTPYYLNHKPTTFPLRFSRHCVKLHCGAVANVFFISHTDYEVYHSMEAENVDIHFLWQRLQNQLDHLTIYERRRVGSALILAFEAHNGQFRKSGEPFITHPVEVARILGGLRLDADTIVAGLLHDTVEDTDRLSFEEIENRFGSDVRRIVEAETRWTKMTPICPGDSVKDLDFRHFFTCLSKDVRIVLVKLADRLHNMRTMKSMRSEKQKEKAAETLQVFAPLAGVLGLDRVKEEMEELSLIYLDPGRYTTLKEHLRKLESEQKKFLSEAQESLQKQLDADPVISSAGIRVHITPRQKSLYSLYTLCERSKWNLQNNQELRHVAQLHVLLETTTSFEDAARLCYYVMGVVHLLWSPIPGKIHDYISTPKLTSWRGLATTVWPSSGPRLITPVDVLIQTSQMSVWSLTEWSSWNLNGWMDNNEVIAGRRDSSSDHDDHECNGNGAVNGTEFQASASPSHPKNGKLFEVNGSLMNGTLSTRKSPKSSDLPSGDMDWDGLSRAQLLWVENLQKWQEEIGTDMSPRDYVDCVRDEFLSPSVYVFTPAGEFIQLPKGATVLDFAYHVHSDIGNRAAGARVDGVSVGPGYVLKNAQVVEILTTTTWKVSQEYLNALRSRIPALQTTSARKKLKKFLKIISRQLEQRPPRMEDGSWRQSLAESSFWVRIYCEDKKGVLADLIRVMSDQGLSITKHSGHRRAEGDFVMKYDVHDPGGKSAEQLSHALESVEGCIRVEMACTLPNLSSGPRFWLYP